MKIGVLGAGQLGRMLALAGYPLGFTFRFFDPAPDGPASAVAEQHVGEYSDLAALNRFADGLDVCTYEFENVPLEAARHLAARVPLYPPPIALETAQDRLNEKTMFADLGIPTPRFAPVDDHVSLTVAVELTGLPAVLKTRRMGYDGKGQRVVRTIAEAEQAVVDLGGHALILEEFVPFQRELSVITVRGAGGEVGHYPLVENTHREGILRRSVSPAPSVTSAAIETAQSYGARLLDRLDYRGVLALELFESDGKLIANEMAPRVHNSGHGTIEGNVTSQFENHVRAVAGLPLGDPSVRGQWTMHNIIGDLPTPSETEETLRTPGAHLHLYGKAARPGRKLGHITTEHLAR